MAKPSISAGAVRAFIDFAVSKGAGEAKLLHRSRIDVADLADPDARVPFDRYVALVRAAKELTGDPALALHFGEAFDVAQLSIVGLMAQACEFDVIELLRAHFRSVELVGSVDLDLMTWRDIDLYAKVVRAEQRSFVG